MDRALRMRRRELDHAEGITGHDVGVKAPSEPLVEGLGPIDIGDGQRDDLEPHVDAPRLHRVRRRSAAYVGTHLTSWCRSLSPSLSRLSRSVEPVRSLVESLVSKSCLLVSPRA